MLSLMCLVCGRLGAYDAMYVNMCYGLIPNLNEPFREGAYLVIGYSLCDGMMMKTDDWRVDVRGSACGEVNNKKIPRPKMNELKTKNPKPLKCMKR